MKKTTKGEGGTVRRPRGRPRSFDREAALERAMEVFWTRGFESATLHDLTAAMGINPPSLYAAFGDKEKLYLEALGRYQALRRAVIVRMLEDAPTAREAIEAVLRDSALELCKPGHPRGCMIAMSMSTCTTASAEMQATIAERRAVARRYVKDRFDRGVREGDVPPGTDTGALADFYNAVFTGMSMQAREGASRKSLLATVVAAMRAFPAAEQPRARAVRAAASVEHER
jgi:AcrR family transcriptional regulator